MKRLLLLLWFCELLVVSSPSASATCCVLPLRLPAIGALMLSTAAARLSSSLLVCPLLESLILSRRMVVPRNSDKSYASSTNSSSLDSSADESSASESEEEHSPLHMCSKPLKVKETTYSHIICRLLDDLLLLVDRSMVAI